MSRPSNTLVWRYSVASIAVLSAVAARWVLDPALGDRAPYAVFIIAAILVVWRAGLGPGCVVAVAGALVVVGFDARESGGMPSGRALAEMGVFLAFSAFCIGLIASLRAGQQRAQERVETAIREREALLAARKLAEAQMQAGEHRFAQFMQHLTGLAWIKDLEGRYLYVNDAAAAAFGRPAEEIHGKTDEKIFPEATAAQFRENDRRALEGIATQSIEFLKQSDGIVHQSIVNKFPILGADGQPAMVGGMAIDITDCRQMEAELRQSEERLRIALEAGRMGAWHWEIATNEVNWSPGLAALHGLEPGGFAGTFEAFQNDIHPDDRVRVLSTIQSAVARGGDCRNEYRIVWPDGSVHWLESRGRLLTDSDGKPLRMVGICADVTDRKRTETMLRFLADSSRSLASVVDYRTTLECVAQVAVPHFSDWCIVDLAGPDGTLERLAVVHADPERRGMAEDLKRRYPPDPASPIGPFHVYRTGEPQLTARLSPGMLRQVARDQDHERILEGLGLVSYMCVPLKAQGRVHGAISFISAESGRIYGQDDLLIASDVAHRAAIAIENARLYSELKDADRRKDEFLATLAHELRNPLVPIRSGLDLLAMQPSGNRETIELMQRQLEHLVRLVDDLLDVSRIIRGKVELRKEPVSLAVVINRAVEAVRWTLEKQEQELIVRVPDENVTLLADEVRIVQVIENLLNNASKYTDRKGRIELSAELEDSQAVICVRDNGVGIEAELLPKVFDLFTQSERSLDRAHGGLGIGLTLVRNLVEMHGGTVFAHSEGPGRGSVFTVQLPIATELCALAPHSALPETRAARRILVVDDNRAAARLLSQLLAHMGDHQIEVAHDGESALRKACEFRPELILLDIGLPGMNGYAVANSLRADPSFGNVVLAALTGYGQAEDRRRALEAGFDAHLVKPPALADIAQLLAHPKLAEAPAAAAGVSARN